MIDIAEDAGGIHTHSKAISGVDEKTFVITFSGDAV